MRLQRTPIPRELLTNAYFMLMIVTYGNTTTRYDRRIQRNRCHYSYSIQSLLFGRIPNSYAVHYSAHAEVNIQPHLKFAKRRKREDTTVSDGQTGNSNKGALCGIVG